MNDPQDPDGLSEFAPEFGAEATSRAKTRAERGDEDWLSVFRTEPFADRAPRAEALSSSDDELNQFLPGAPVDHSSDDEDEFLDLFPHQVPAVIVSSRQSSAAPWAAAIVAVVICVLLGTRSLYPAWWNAGRVDTPSFATSTSNTVEPSSSQVSNTLPPAPRFSTPPVERGIPSRTLRQLNLVPIRVPQVAIANARPDRRAPDAAPTARAVSAAPRATVLSAQRTDRVPAVDTIPLAPVVVPNRTGEELLPETPRVPLRPDATFALLTTPARSEAPTQEYAVRQALNSYQKAYEDLDVAATAAVWPSVDRRALARAFDTLKSQGLDFKNCAITVTDSSATARCRGTLQVVRKVGNSMPMTAEQEWVFKMRRLGADWKIDAVAASQESGLSPQRTRTQG